MYLKMDPFDNFMVSCPQNLLMELRNYEENTKASKLDRPSGLGEYDQKQMGIIPVSRYAPS